MRLADLGTVVTGVASGVGNSAIAFLLKDGAKTAAICIDAGAIFKPRHKLKLEPVQAAPLFSYVVDLSNEEKVKKAGDDGGGGYVNDLVNRRTYLEELVVYKGGFAFLAQWAKSHFRMTREVIPAVLASNAVVVADTRLWGRQLVTHGIRVAAISPGLIEMPILSAKAPTELNNFIEWIQLGRQGNRSRVMARTRDKFRLELPLLGAVRAPSVVELGGRIVAQGCAAIIEGNIADIDDDIAIEEGKLLYSLVRISHGH